GYAPDTVANISYKNMPSYIRKLQEIDMYVFPFDQSERLAEDLKRYMTICGNHNWTNDTIYVVETYNAPYTLLTTHITCNSDTLYARYDFDGTFIPVLAQVSPYDSEYAKIPVVNDKYYINWEKPDKLKFDLVFSTDFSPLYDVLENSAPKVPESSDDLSEIFLMNVITRIYITDGITNITRIICYPILQLQFQS
ncbi:MAG: hypothetical protein K2F63_07100, partial [Muribaculaceae bacterium]|nr:hypothetical protein [Muribaculaceae bacterium]